MQAALAAPAVSNLLIPMASIGNIGMPYPAVMGFLVLFLTTPLIAGLLLWRMGAGTKTIAAVAVVSVARWVVFLVSVRDPFAYYAWPADVVLSIVLLVIALRVGRGATTTEAPWVSFRGQDATGAES
ncbi:MULTISPECIES: hypothetical protein [Micrococcus]|uniref:hypothetical protein n=1 Tax=Micrococcus luteus TaxID=1270 RepID=UPI0019D012D4|nr:hypothetical protein [Micrococcus luteus]MBN6768963.1 hypothetical protein [Micrococcus luteus]MBN6828825.1 hypothetical protein [Micrococcus luteus]MBN6846901.1 hypothetical protein [Micrococcus luteus]MBN6863370.1 hypothetical protein [Micrococcus luteus]MBN6865467.1 hypothetical protein [Micrococcus luteus]